jgi:group II intron reverse transcriptase/maturase
MRTSLRGIANKARKDPRHRFRNLFGLLNEESLKYCWGDLNKKAAAGVDGVKAREYAEDLDSNIAQLAVRVKEKRYKARLVRRKHIPKGDGRSTRPLGIPVLEDRLLQLTVSRILEAIYEPQFLPCNWAYRPNRSAQEALRDLTGVLQFKPAKYLVDADIKGFFDNIDHEKLMEILEHRIDDRPFLRLIRKWLKAGVLEEDGKVRHTETGCPQGGCISPILANIYLHHVLDEWFANVVIPHSGTCYAYMCRYADDIVFVFQRWADVDLFYRELPKRLALFGLELSKEKTRLIPFNRYNLGAKSKSFEFLGLEFRWVKDRQGQARVMRRTARKRQRASLARIKKWIKDQRSTPVRTVMLTLRRKLHGYYNYYGVRGNSYALKAFYREVRGLLMKWLNRRSHRRSYSWKSLEKVLKRFEVPEPRITEKRTRQLVFDHAC